jgi:V8-like Glu-specific endopeptidase
MIKYKGIDTEGGQSGSGLWMKEDNDKYFIFGIHISGCEYFNRQYT